MSMPKLCVTHHHACDCREEMLAKRIAELEKKWIEAIGWAYADCCTTLDAGGDPRQTEMSDVLHRATIDLQEQGE